MFGIDIEVFMVKISFDQKPYRELMMQSFGAKCNSSPSSLTDFGKKLLEENPDNPGVVELETEKMDEQFNRQ